MNRICKKETNIIGLRVYRAFIACACGAMFFALTACQDDDMLAVYEENTAQQASDEYWYTRTRSAAQQVAMLKSHAIGYSYDAIYGDVCDINSVRCQVLDLTKLQDEGIYYTNGETVTNYYHYSAHSISEAYSKMANSNMLSASFLTSKSDYKRIAAIYERRNDDAVVISQTCVTQCKLKALDLEKYAEVMNEGNDLDSCRFLTPSFIYALNKVKKAMDSEEAGAVAVVDSLIDIFGTHVVTKAVVGGSVKLDLVTTVSDIKTLTNEQNITEKCIDLYFTKSYSSSSSQMQTFFEGIVKNAELSLSVRGGDVSAFNELVANPYSDKRSESIMAQWMKGLKENVSDEWDSRQELADMEVTPIWEFIPDERLSKYIRSRIEASAPLMQELFGNRNFIDVKLPVEAPSGNCTIGGQKYSAPWWVTDFFAANRHVATLCREWVPEIDPNNTVNVVYPIYENEIQMNAGVCVHNNVAYNVRWIYNQFLVDTLATGSRVGDRLYLQAGYINVAPYSEGYSYMSPEIAMGYEWPNSIDVNGNTQNKNKICATRKFLGNFFLDTTQEFTGLPNWYYTTTSLYNKHYDSYLKGKGTKPYALSGLSVQGSSEDDYLNNRMVRSATYMYYYNPKELSTYSLW